MEQKDYYDILGLKEDAGHKEVRDAYRRLALRHHPDRNRNNPEAAERMKAINEAYAVLSDPRKRREYDALRKTYGSSAYGQFRQTHSDQDIFRGSDIGQILDELSRAFGYRSFEDIFRESYGAGYRTFEFRRPGAFSRVFTGGVSGGQGAGNSTPGVRLLERLIRYGLKKKWGVELPEKGGDLKDVVVVSPDEARLGGKSHYSSKKTGRDLMVTIPPNTRAGQQLRLKGMGEPGRGGAEAGELYLTVNIRRSLIQKAKDVIAAIRFSFR
ncbi:MAG: J domain-containing protein [Deltaproteobacteria bacterium]|nr:J domain-containing protein [Deltaproteobacteria bacterium]